VDHLLLHYEVDYAIWTVFVSRLGCLGLCLDMLICMPGGYLAVCEVLQCGRWCLSTFYGVYGGKMNYISFEDRERTMEEI